MNLFHKSKNGTVISVPKPPYTHFGILFHDYFGRAFVISNSGRKDRVVKETLSEFCSGKKYKIHNLWGKYNSEQVVNRAKKLIGSKYSAAKYNCEHFVRQVHGLPLESPQFNSTVGLTLLSGLAYFLLKNK